jgi:inhibitor of KinA sporulation pathway (predicted exonuclease)
MSNVVCFDLEFNQKDNNPKIIQIGYMIVNAKTKKVFIAKRVYVDPNEAITEDIVKLTGITDEVIAAEGKSLTDAYQEFVDDIEHYQCSKFPVTWGQDHFDLRNHLGVTWEDYIFRRRFFDIKSLYQFYAMVKPQGTTVAGLGRALSNLGLDWDPKYGQQHDGLADAYNTLRMAFTIGDKLLLSDEIVKAVDKKKGLIF